MNASSRPGKKSASNSLKKSSEEVTPQEDRKQLTLNQLSTNDKTRAMDVFVRKLADFLKQGDAASRQDVMKQTGDALSCSFDVRQFDNFLCEAAALGHVKIILPTLPRVSEKLVSEFGLKSATVVGGADEKTFARVAARIFLRNLSDIGGKIRNSFTTNAQTLNVGLVSGSTVKIIIDALQASDDWYADFGVDPKSLPEIIVFALNVSPTLPKRINFNATILAPRLADAIIKHGGTASAYGINAPVVVTPTEKTEIDHKPQTKEVLQFTEPRRIDPDSPNVSNLHVILTGAGELGSTTETPSIFQSLAAGAGIDLEDKRKTRGLVGDLGFAPLSATGDVLTLNAKSEAGKEGELGPEMLFYSAASLDVFKWMAGHEDRAVVLAARSRAKWRIILASIGHKNEPLRRFVSHLVIDQPAAEALLKFEDLA